MKRLIGYVTYELFLTVFEIQLAQNHHISDAVVLGNKIIVVLVLFPPIVLGFQWQETFERDDP